MASVELLEDLAVPYVLVVYSTEQDGTWVRRAEYPELPGCSAEAFSAVEALDNLEALRVRLIVEMRRRGERPPRPRAPLKRSLTFGTVDLDDFLNDLLGEPDEEIDRSS